MNRGTRMKTQMCVKKKNVFVKLLETNEAELSTNE